MKKVQKATQKTSALNELYKRYEDRGATYDRSPEYAEQKSREINARTGALRSSVARRGVTDLKQYRNGVFGTRRYMTERDFASYYKATREYMPDANVELGAPILLKKVDKTRRNTEQALNTQKKIDVKKKLMKEADRANPKAFERKARPKKEKT